MQQLEIFDKKMREIRIDLKFEKIAL